MGGLADEFAQPVDVPWRRPNLGWTSEETEQRDETDVVREGGRARVGQLSFHTVRDHWLYDEDIATETWVEAPDGPHLHCAADFWPTSERETVLDFRQTRDLRVTQFRCHVLRWDGAACEPWVDPRWTVEQVVSHDRVWPSAAAHEALPRYHRHINWLELARGALMVLAAGVEWRLHRPGRPAPSPLPPAYRGRALGTATVVDRWRSNALVRARWWLWFGVLGVPFGLFEVGFPLGLVSGSHTVEMATPAPAVGAIPALSDPPTPAVPVSPSRSDGGDRHGGDQRSERGAREGRAYQR